VKQNTKFCTVGDVDVDLEKFGSAFAIDGLGDLPLSMRPKDVREIIAFADTAPYGKGTKTLIDQSVRNSLEINPDYSPNSGEKKKPSRKALR
jgi:hypothetical protein